MELVGILSKDHCLYFYIFAILSLVSCLLTILLGILNSKQNLSKMAWSALSFFVMYYIYRLFYSMCEGSLH